MSDDNCINIGKLVFPFRTENDAQSKKDRIIKDTYPHANQIKWGEVKVGISSEHMKKLEWQPLS